MPTYVFVEPLKSRQRKNTTHQVQAIDRDAAFAQLAKLGIVEFTQVHELPRPLIDAITLKTALSLGVGVTNETSRLEAAVSVLLRISDVGRAAEVVIGQCVDGGPYRAYFRALGVEKSPKGVRVKGMALVAPPDPETYTESQGEGVRKWLAEEIEQITLAPEDVTIPDPEDYGTIKISFPWSVGARG